MTSDLKGCRVVSFPSTSTCDARQSRRRHRERERPTVDEALEEQKEKVASRANAEARAVIRTPAEEPVDRIAWHSRPKHCGLHEVVRV